MVCIHSEHAIGFLKGRFQSLKNLRILIKSEHNHKFATYWIAACICLHNWAMKHEAEERARENDSDSSEEEALDPFVTHNLSSASESNAPQPLTGTAPLARAASN